MNSNLNENQSQPEIFDRHEWRRQRREARWAARGAGNYSGAWIAGVILIGIGVILFLQNMKIMVFTNWWAFFILIPAIATFGTAWRLYQSAGGHLTLPARSSMIAGLIFTTMAVVFLFGLDLGIIGPALLLMAGAALILNFVIR